MPRSASPWTTARPTSAQNRGSRPTRCQCVPDVEHLVPEALELGPTRCDLRSYPAWSDPMATSISVGLPRSRTARRIVVGPEAERRGVGHRGVPGGARGLAQRWGRRQGEPLEPGGRRGARGRLPNSSANVAPTRPRARWPRPRSRVRLAHGVGDLVERVAAEQSAWCGPRPPSPASRAAASSPRGPTCWARRTKSRSVKAARQRARRQHHGPAHVLALHAEHEVRVGDQLGRERLAQVPAQVDAALEPMTERTCWGTGRPPSSSPHEATDAGMPAWSARAAEEPFGHRGAAQVAGAAEQDVDGRILVGDQERTRNASPAPAAAPATRFGDGQRRECAGTVLPKWPCGRSGTRHGPGPP